jgi:hypothetical protein
MLNGRVASLDVTSKFPDKDTVELVCRAGLIDPLGRVKVVALHYLKSEALSKKPGQRLDGSWDVLPESTRVPFALAGQQATATFPVEGAEKGDRRLWVQPSFVDGDGRTHYLAPGSYRIPLRSPPGVAKRALRPDQEEEDEPAGGFASKARRSPNGGPVTIPKTADEERGGGFSARRRAESKPQATHTSLRGNFHDIGGLKITEIDVAPKEVPRCLFWAPDGKTFFLVEQTGALRRVALDGFSEELHLDTGHPCSWLATSAEGLVLTVSGRHEVWLLDPTTFQVKSKISVPPVHRAVSSPALSVAFAVGKGTHVPGDTVVVIDLKKGEAVRQYESRDLGDSLTGFHTPVVTPNGKYLFTRGGIEQLQRFRIKGEALEYLGSSDRIAHNGHDIELSPDSFYVALPSGGGNRGRRRYSTNIYKVSNLGVPEVVVESGAYPQALGIDVKAGLIYAQNIDTPLIVFRSTGLKAKEFKLPGFGRGASIKQFAVRPDGGKFLLLSDAALDFIEVPPELKEP